MSIFKERDVLNLIFQYIPTDQQKEFALVNKSCYRVYSDFMDCVRKTIPIYVLRRYLPVITYYCRGCDILSKKTSKTGKTKHCDGCHKRLCVRCSKTSFNCYRCEAMYGFDESDYRKKRYFCKKCIKMCPSCNKLKHCFTEFDCTVCEQTVCKDCLTRRSVVCLSCQSHTCECGQPKPEDRKDSFCYKCGCLAYHKETKCSERSCLSKKKDTFRTYCCKCLSFNRLRGNRTCPQCEKEEDEFRERMLNSDY